VSSSKETQSSRGRPEGAKEISFAVALIPVGILVALLYFFIVRLGGSGHLPLMLAASVAGISARLHGWRWKELQSGMLSAIHMAMGAILILLVIGMLMGAWLAAGVVPALVSWGLELMSPSYFLPATCLVCSVVSLVSGSSWSTAGTVGLALIGVGNAMGIEAAMTAGAVISGAYFGDKLSPMSDTTNLAPAMAGTDLFTHIKHMMWTTGPSWVISMVVFSFLGAGLEDAASPEAIERITAVINQNFDPGWRHLIPLVVVGLLVIKKMPALPSLGAGVLAGALLAVIDGMKPGEVSAVQAMQDTMAAIMDGYKPTTGDAAVDELLARGGLSSMSNTVLLILSAMVFGGIMERTGQLRALAQQALSRAESTGSMIMSTVLTAIGTNILAADQYIAVVVPGRMYAEEFRERGLHPKNLSRALEDGGTITSPLIPWNTCGAFMSTTLGVATGAYLPYCILNLVNPVVSIIYGYTGFTIEPLGEDEAEEAPLV
jgi:NhaC family Na+:H+ antiporter